MKDGRRRKDGHIVHQDSKGLYVVKGLWPFGKRVYLKARAHTPPRPPNQRMESLIRQYGMSDWRKVFGGVFTYADFVATGVAFVKNRLSRTPVYFGRLGEEAAPLLGDLVKINEAGVVTVDGQVGENEIHRMDNGEWYESQQKSYLIMWMTKRMAAAFVRYADRERPTGLVYVVRDPDTGRVEKIGMPGKYRGEDDDFVYNVTRVRSAPTRVGLRWQAWETPTNLWHNDDDMIAPCKEYDEFPNIMELVARRGAYVELSIDKYGSGSVEDVLLKFLRTPEGQDLTREALAT